MGSVTCCGGFWSGESVKASQGSANISSSTSVFKKIKFGPEHFSVGWNFIKWEYLFSSICIKFINRQIYRWQDQTCLDREDSDTKLKTPGIEERTLTHMGVGPSSPTNLLGETGQVTKTL